MEKHVRRARFSMNIYRVKVKGERRIETFDQHIRFNWNKYQFEVIGLEGGLFADSVFKRWAKFNFNQWVGQDTLCLDKDVRWVVEFLKALAWVAEKK